MRKYLHINLKNQTIEADELQGEAIVKGGRYFIAKTMLAQGAATVDPLSPQNPLIFSAGPFAGTTFSNANRTSVGCKSPLTGGIKEANGGGTFGYGLGQLHLAGFTLYDASDDWVVIHLQKGGGISFDDGTPYLGKGNFEAADMLYERYGKKVALGLCGPVGEYQGLLAGIAFSDNDGRPARLAARGGVGAVMGSKKVKAIIIDLDKIPELHDRKKTMGNLRAYAKLLQADDVITGFYGAQGTMGLTDYTNYVGGLPTRNFSSGQIAGDGEELKMGAEYIGLLNTARGGKQTHACMPGCVIQCSNVYVNAEGEEVVSPVEYETLCLLGTNCGINDADALAELNGLANELGIDTIETGATLAVCMEAGLAEFGDVAWMKSALKEIGLGTENGRLWAQGTARVGQRYGVERVPVIKKQAISAYDPRIIEATGISMMVSAQGADHTTGNVPKLNTRAMTFEEILAASLEAQIYSAAHDSLGLCIFGRSVDNSNAAFLADAINDALGTSLTPNFFADIGRETLIAEYEFNRQAGFDSEDNELPSFFYDQALPPTDQVARFHHQDVAHIFDELLQNGRKVSGD